MVNAAVTDGVDSSPLVSVVVPTYYRNDVLRETLRSVRDQSYSPVEVIVVDDSGEGHAEPVATSFEGVDYVEFDENRGANDARTAGARHADGEFVHFLDDDDRMHEDKLEKQIHIFEEKDQIGVVYTGIWKKGDQIDLPDPSIRGHVLESALAFETWPCMTSTMLIDAEVLDEALPLSDRAAAQDLELMIQLARRTEFEYVDEPLLYKRIDLSSLGSSLTAVECRKQIVGDYRSLYERYPDRVRERALARTYESEGALLLRKRGWSPRAIAALARHAYYMPDERVKSVGKLLAACFGKTGWKAIRRVNRVV